MPGERQTPTVRLRRLAAELRSLRTAAGLTRDEVAARTGINVATLYRIEHARVRPQTRTLRTLLGLYGADEPQQAALAGLLRDARQRGWLDAYQSGLPEQYTTYIGLEGEARSAWNYESLFVPGLLQTEDYARAVIRAGFPSAGRDEIEGRVKVRIERQEVLHGATPLELWGIVDEAAVRRQVGGAGVMRAQLRWLLDATQLPHVTFQVIPFGAGAHAGMPGSFVFMQFAEATISDVVYIDHMAGELFLEEEMDVRRYKLVFEHLRAVAVSPGASRSLLADLAART
ncbi:MAG TPA: helix-turn-helix transcriptional regulator [Streptosporangiaceae bacterium]|nr:helix-turn-helix transcriptional regulator [Streptosporangiaceae bacterium]